MSLVIACGSIFITSTCMTLETGCVQLAPAQSFLSRTQLVSVKVFMRVVPVSAMSEKGPSGPDVLTCQRGVQSQAGSLLFLMTILLWEGSTFTITSSLS